MLATGHIRIVATHYVGIRVSVRSGIYTRLRVVGSGSLVKLMAVIRFRCIP
jgi:hypothetical protein